MKRNIKRIIIAVLSLCFCLAFFQQPAEVEAAKALKITASAKVVGGGDFLKGESKLTITFKLNQSKKAVVSIINDDDETVFKKSYNKCTANKKNSITWNGKNAKGKYVEGGTYYVVVTSGSQKVELEGIEFLSESDFAGGNGSKKNPYQVSNTDQFYAIAMHNGLYFKQTKNLDFADQKFIPLFTSDNGFSGTYNGNGKTISNIDYTSEGEFIGLFRCVSETGVVKKVTVKDSSFVGKKYGAAIAGRSYGSVLNCKVTDSAFSLSSQSAAALVGENYGKITDCVSVNNIMNSGDNAGSISGWSNGTVKNCTSTDDIVTADANDAGGIIGVNKGTVDNCKVKKGTVHASSSWYGEAGGIIGTNNGVVKKCLVDDATVIEANYKGGIVGDNSGTIAACTYYGELREAGH